jgi:hypothetical protein
MEDNHRIKNSIKSIVTLRSKLKGTTFIDELKKFKEELNVAIQQKK